MNSCPLQGSASTATRRPLFFGFVAQMCHHSETFIRHLGVVPGRERKHSCFRFGLPTLIETSNPIVADDWDAGL